MAKDISSNGKSEVHGTAAFSKFMKVLQTVSDFDGEPTVPQIANAAGLPRATAYRIVAALLAEGMLAEAGQDRGLLLGPRLISLAGRSWDRSDLRKAAKMPLASLRDELDETVHLAVNSGDEMIYIDKLESRRNVRMASRIGTRVPIYSSSVGKAWLAALPPDAADATMARLTLIRRTDHTVTDRRALAAQIEAVRKDRFATDLQENELDICCYGMPIVDDTGTVVGCISISFPRYRFEEMPQTTVVAKMEACVRAITAGFEDG